MSWAPAAITVSVRAKAVQLVQLGAVLTVGVRGWNRGGVRLLPLPARSGRLGDRRRTS